MTSFDSSPSLTAWRTLLALAVVFVMLASTGWTALQRHGEDGTARERALSAWEKGRVGPFDLPDPHAPPKRLAAFFASLSTAQRTGLADRYPLVVGNLNGAPLTLRYRANRLAVIQARDVERERMDDSRLSVVGRHQAGRRMHRFESMAGEGRQILAFDPTGDGRAAEVFGDLDSAGRVSVVVPGADTNLLTFERTKRRYTAPVGMARSLYEAERAASPRTRTAVIAWADYTAPAGIGVDAVTGRLASKGAGRLKALTSALPGTSRVSLICHSYGSVVCGIAARRLPARVTDVAVAGSPGMRAESAGQLDSRARVWAMRDSDDWIQAVPYLEVGGLGHGADPVTSDFGARVLSAQGAAGHTGYFEPGTESLRNFADIGVGSYRNTSCADDGDGCRSGISDGEVI
ncbi:alpha/beta hydrolase [Streptomyces sp. NBC_01716]|uniref:alpha/beta hydrolase n=1 Tax=Streptomyces sp. NBC_01716 TaxID=2975917 RepID=UPI002E33B4A6|nr:alpha/beta hydrolase [Streptomyces sp. NBC_01716]